jgi:hypothetical protein
LGGAGRVAVKRLNARAKLAPVQPQTERFQAVHSGLAAPVARVRLTPRIPLNHAENGSGKLEMRPWLEGAIFRRG